MIFFFVYIYSCKLFAVYDIGYILSNFVFAAGLEIGIARGKMED